jgi:hypothetical protein
MKYMEVELLKINNTSLKKENWLDLVRRREKKINKNSKYLEFLYSTINNYEE